MLRFLLLCTCVLATLSSLPAQDLQLFEAFTHEAILQRDVPHPFWGWAGPKKKVTVTVRWNLDNESKEYRTKADKDGRWEVTLDPRPAGGPYRIEVASAGEETYIASVYYGDVYLLSGQSNMEWLLRQSDPENRRVYEVMDPLVRELKVNKSYASTPREHLPLDPGYEPRWRVGNERNIGNFSAVGSYFAHYLRQEVPDVPIGLLNSSWGGSRIEPWMSPAALGMDVAEQLAERDDAIAAAGKAGRARFRQDFPGRDIPTEDKGEEMGWLTKGHDDSAWPTMTLPTFWEAAGYPSVDGHFYFRGTFELTAAQAAQPITLYLGAIDDGDWTYVNGELVGAHPNAYSTPRVYEVDADKLMAGENEIAFRIYDGQGGGGFAADPSSFYIQTAKGKVSLAGDYKFNIGEFRVDAQPNQVPTILYNAMIAPLQGYPIRATLWYQGESNAGSGDNVKYAEHMRSLVRQWRGHFLDAEEMPFYWVQLANFQDSVKTANEPGWAIIRNSQSQATDLPNTGMAVISDLGEYDDIHPQNKWEVGRRLSLHALNDIYGIPKVADSPVAESASRVGGYTVVDFRHVPRGLMVKGEERYGYVRGFTVLGRDGEWRFAQALINQDGKSVIVFNPTGQGVVRVRYNWANNPDGNLYSTGGLPVDGFDLEVR